MITSTVLNDFGVNMASRYIKDRPEQFRNLTQKGKTPAWGLTYGQWVKLRHELVMSKKAYTVVTKYMKLTRKLDPNTPAHRVNFAHALTVTFPGQTITTMRGANKSLGYQGINI